MSPQILLAQPPSIIVQSKQLSHEEGVACGHCWTIALSLLGLMRLPEKLQQKDSVLLVPPPTLWAENVTLETWPDGHWRQ